MRAVILVLTDSHAGHKFGLMAPGVTLYDESPTGQPVEFTPQMTEFQKYLWELYTERIIPTTQQIAGTDPLHIFHLGDMLHGNKHPEQTISTRVADQVAIGTANLEALFPAFPSLRSVQLVAGTGAHEFGEASATLMIAAALRGKHPALDIAPLYHGAVGVNGALIDIAHHGPGQSSREWLRGNNARYYLKSLVDAELRNGRQPPDLTLRGHIHTPVNEVITEFLHGNFREYRVVVGPPLSGLTDYARQVTRSTYEITVGAVVVEVDNGRILPPTFITGTLDVRTRKTL